ncbi:hypothetical protein N0V85_006427 [Neurospora sp. IMI 360204]|nr:hypothetical protein N0V85_006427 [Neurospora sp. IMI 360204]
MQPPPPLHHHEPPTPDQPQPVFGYNSFGGAAIALAMRPYAPVNEPPNNFYRDMIFQQPGQSRQNSYQHEQPVSIQFGTDTSFSQSTFTPQRTQESSEVMSQAQLKALASIQEEGGPPKKRRATVDNTKNNDAEMASPGSLVTFSNSPYSPFSQSGFAPSSPMTSQGGRRSAGSGVGGARSKKLSRQGLPTPDEATDSQAQGGDPQSPNEDEDKPTRPGKRRRSYKEKKPNLTLEQKRLNHIDSEKRRRYMIKSAYDNLSIIVPGYKEAGVSKAGGIQLAVDFLQKMMEENEGLKERLERAREKAGFPRKDVEMTEGGENQEGREEGSGAEEQ